MGDASPTPSVASPHESAFPSVSEAPLATATATVSPEIPGSWTAAGSFGSPDARFVVRDLVAWSNRLMAVGSRYESTNFPAFGAPPPHFGVVWSSADGELWEEVTPPATFEGAELQSLIVTSDGVLIVRGIVRTTDRWDVVTDVAWESVDGSTWEPTTIGSWPATSNVVDLEQGDRGYLAVTRDDAHDGVWFSLDGRTWDMVYQTPDRGESAERDYVWDVGAGPEGFVAVLVHDPGDGTMGIASVLASADGQQWIDGATPSPSARHVTALGPDWLMAGQTWPADPTSGFTPEIWFSANGLDWQPRGSVELDVRQVEGHGDCAEFASGLAEVGVLAVLSTTLSYGCSEGGYVTAGGAWHSADGTTWEKLPFGAHAAVGGMAIFQGRYIVATDGGTGSPQSASVTFWVGETP